MPPLWNITRSDPHMSAFIGFLGVLPEGEKVTEK